MGNTLGTDNSDYIVGDRDDDVIDGLDGNDRIVDPSGENTISGGGNDRIVGGRDNDTIDGGSGSDNIWARNGDDIGIYRPSENIGWNQASSTGSGGASSDATGVLDARAGTVTLHLDELNVGRGSGGVGTAMGTLRWDQATAIHATSVIFGRGSNATGVLEVPGSGTFKLGTAADPVGSLFVGFNDVRFGAANAELDFRGIDPTSSADDPTFTADIADELSIGRRVTGGGDGTADGTLVLGGNSTLSVGSPGDLVARVNIGWNQASSTGSGGASSDATGLLDTSQGVFTAHLGGLNIGFGATVRTALGTFIMGSGATVNANTVNIGVGAGATGSLLSVDDFAGLFNAPTVNLAAGLFDFGNNTLTIDSGGNILVQTFNLTGGELWGESIDFDPSTGTINFLGGRLSVDTFNGGLEQDGGVLAPRDSLTDTTVNGDYALASAGTLELDLLGAGASQYEQLFVNGAVDLNADLGTGGALEILLGFTPGLGSTFTIVANDESDPIIGFFDGLPDLSTFDVINGMDLVTFEIDYSGGDGNDIVLTTQNVLPAPAPVTALASEAAGGMGGPVNGTDGDDVLSGSASDDIIIAGAGNDTVKGGAGNDEIDGGPGQDTLDGGTDDDWLLGGIDEDVFVFNRGTGRDTVADFVPGTDVLDLTAYGFIDVNAVRDVARADGSDTVLDLDVAMEDQVTPVGLAPDELQDGDVIV